MACFLKKRVDLPKKDRDYISRKLKELKNEIEKGIDKNRIRQALNLNDGFGQTAIHFAASSGQFSDANSTDVGIILEFFDDIDIAIQDADGDTFLHCYMSSYQVELDTNLIGYILEGNYKCCSGEELEKLLKKKNKSGHSVFHLYCLYTLTTKDMCKKFLYAGADLSTCDSKRENVLHNLIVRKKAGNCNVPRYLKKKGVDINQQNIFQDTPLLTTIFSQQFDCNTAELLLEMGADPTLQNNVGKTPLMEMILYRMKENVIKMCLEKTPDVNKTDNFGSTCLHYAAWANADVSIVKLLKEFGAQVFEDDNGNLPCTIAEQRGYNELVVELCQCMNGAHEDKKILNGTGTYCFEDLYTQKRLLKEPLAGTINVFELLNTPFTGSLTSVNEADEIKNAVIYAVTRMCSKIAEKDALLNNTVVVSGSVSEDTKVGLPDEFDFCCLIDPITEAFEDDERKSSSDPDYAYLRLKENFRNSPLREMVDNDGYLLSHLILMRFMNVLREVLDIDLSSVINNPNLRLKSEYRSFYLYGPNVTFTLKWTGPVYKDIIIGIDLVPAIKLSKWPPGSRLNSLVVDLNKLPQGAMGLLQKIERESPESKIRVSASRAEYMYMRELPQIARDAYMVAKILLSEQICPTIYLTQSDQTPIKHNIISYYLKTCMFHIFQEPFLQDMKSFDYRTSAFKEKENKLNECVVEIFKRLAECTKSKRLPGFIFPWQNIFEVFRFEHLNTNYFKDRHVAIENACVNQTIFARLILNMLGEKVDLSLDF